MIITDISNPENMKFQFLSRKGKGNRVKFQVWYTKNNNDNDILGIFVVDFDEICKTEEEKLEKGQKI